MQRQTGTPPGRMAFCSLGGEARPPSTGDPGTSRNVKVMSGMAGRLVSRGPRRQENDKKGGLKEGRCQIIQGLLGLGEDFGFYSEHGKF